MVNKFYGKRNKFFYLGLTGMALLVLLYWVSGMQTLSAAFSYGDEGFVAEGARRVFRGEVPYRDFFTGVTPGVYYFYALLFKLFGPTFFTLRLGVVLTAGAVFFSFWWLLYRLGMRRVLPFAMAAVYLPHYGGGSWFIASYHWLVLALCLFSLGFLLSDKNDVVPKWQIAVSGGLAALAAFTLQHKGGLWMLAATGALLALPSGQRWRAISWFWGGVLVVAMPLVIGFIVEVGWNTLVADLITFPLSQYHNVEAHRGDVFETMRKTWTGARSAWLFRESLVDWARIYAWNAGYVGYLVVCFLPFSGLFLIASMWRQGTVCRHKLAVLTAFFVASYLGALHRLADSTLVFAAPSAVLIVILFLQVRDVRSLSSFALGLRRWVVCGWLILFGTVSVAYGVVGGLSPRVTTQTPAGPVDSFLSGEAQTMEGVLGYLGRHRQPGEKVFCYPYQAMFYFILQAKNPTPYDLLTYPLNTQAQLDHTRLLLEADQTRWLLWGRNQMPVNSLDAYLREKYIVRARFKYVDVFERR